VGLTYISVTIGVAIAAWCAWYCRRLAAEKGRNVVLWTILGLVLTVVAVPVLVLLPLTPDGDDGPHDAPGTASAEEAREGATSE
jgi:hypothetical protein